MNYLWLSIDSYFHIYFFYVIKITPFIILCLFFRFLGHLYAAESLIKLNRISEAIMHLSPDNVNDMNIGGPGGDGPGGNNYIHFGITSCYSADILWDSFYNVDQSQ